MNRLLTLFALLVAPLVAPMVAANLAPQAPELKATGYILLDFNSGQVLAEKNADVRMEPESLTEIMTSYVVAQEITKGKLSLEQKVKISEKAWKMKGLRMFVEARSLVSVSDLLRGMIIQSGNDAAVALAEATAGTENDFVALMNQVAQRLGLHETHFENASGLPHANQYSTPRDLAILSNALIADYPEHYKFYAEKSFTYNKIKQDNGNPLLWDNEAVDGLKTGFSESSAYSLVASAQQEGMRVTCVVVGVDSKKNRAEEGGKLISYGFRFFETHLLYRANAPITSLNVWKGANSAVSLGLAQDFYLTIPKGQYKNLDAHMSINSQVFAPVRRGQKYGILYIRLGEVEYARHPLLALEDVNEGGFWRSLIDAIRLSLE